jgi:hypothetical protein
MDVHVPGPITTGLRRRSVDVITAQEDGAARLADDALLDRVTALGRLLFTQDDDFLVEAARRQRSGHRFAGVIYAHQLRVSVGKCIADLELFAKAYDPGDLDNCVEYLPL